MLITVGDLIRFSWKTYIAHWKKLAIYMLFLFLPTFILTIIGALAIFVNLYSTTTILPADIFIFILYILSGLFSFWTSMATIKTIGSIIKNNTALPLKEAYGSTLKVFWSALWVAILVTLAVFGGTLLLVVPGIIFMGWYAFANQAVVLDGFKGTAAMRESKRLVVGRWFAVIWRLVAAVLLFLIVIVTIKYVIMLAVVALANSRMVIILIDGLLQTLLSSVIGPLVGLATVALYFSAKENPVEIAPDSKTTV